MNVAASDDQTIQIKTSDTNYAGKVNSKTTEFSFDKV